MSDVRLIRGDCLDVLRGMDSGSVDAVVTDPPSGIAFMSRNWDTFRCRSAFIDFLAPRLVECLRVARSGARMLCWAIPRTSHWTATAVEDAGWLIEDRVSHIFGQGFPKAKSKLKPAMEDWYLARKPGGKVPYLNVDRCRIGYASEADLAATRQGVEAMARSPERSKSGANKHEGWQRPWMAEKPTVDVNAVNPAGRWPANLCLSHHPACRQVGTKRVKGSGFDRVRPDRMTGAVYGEHKPSDYQGHAGPDGLEAVAAWECHENCPIGQLDEMSGMLKSGSKLPHHKRTTPKGRNNIGIGDGGPDFFAPPGGEFFPGDSGGASRFFATFGYFPKASRRDRGEGNLHPTVKAQDLMRWLIRLICKPGDMLVDPFAGSGSTLLAAMAEGVNVIGIEDDSEPGSFATAERRLAAARLPLGFG
jgi:hypothetical protein